MTEQNPRASAMRGERVTDPANPASDTTSERIYRYLLHWQEFFEEQRAALSSYPAAAEAWKQAWAEVEELARHLRAGTVEPSAEWQTTVIDALTDAPRFPDIRDRRIDTYAALRSFLNGFAALICDQDVGGAEYDQIITSSEIFEDLSEICGDAIQQMIQGAGVPDLGGLDEELHMIATIRTNRT